MRVAVTGGTGFLGRHVVRDLVQRGHSVRMLVRSEGPADVERVTGDLRNAPHLERLCDGMDVLVHMALEAGGQFEGSVVGTERLLSAMARTTCKRLVLVSSMSVYDWSRCGGTITEDSPVEEAPHLYERDAYAVAKVWQERVAREMTREHGWQLVVLRPGFIWGPGRTGLAGLGLKLGPVFLNVAPDARLPMTHVENCARLVVLAVESPQVAGQTFNAVDDYPITSRQFLRLTHPDAHVVSVPYGMARILSDCARTLAQAVFGKRCRLPGVLVPARFVARFKPVSCRPDKARHLLGWVPPLDRAACLQACRR